MFGRFFCTFWRVTLKTFSKPSIWKVIETLNVTFDHPSREIKIIYLRNDREYGRKTKIQYSLWVFNAPFRWNEPFLRTLLGWAITTLATRCECLQSNTAQAAAWNVYWSTKINFINCINVAEKSWLPLSPCNVMKSQCPQQITEEGYCRTSYVSHVLISMCCII